jgi:Tfp pilus assembly protein PilF
MKKDWFTSFAASVVVTALASTTTLASPASMAGLGHRSAKTTSPMGIPSPTAKWDQETAHLPSKQISPVKHPFKYLSASIKEMPIGANRRNSANAVMPPANQHNDSISLSTPVGAPNPQLFISAAQLCESKGEVDKARANYNQALSMWPGQVDVLRAAARMEDRIGQMPVAESLYRQAVTANPQHAGAHNDLGLCLARQGKLEASVTEIEQAVQIQPTKALYRNNAATVLVEMREDQRAIAHLAAVHGAAEANYNFGQLLVQRGRPADATQYFQAAVQQNPQMQHAHEALAKLQTGSTVAADTTTPATTPTITPSGGPTFGPSMTYPSTARSPEFNTSGYIPPRVLPPVAAQPGGPIQR